MSDEGCVAAGAESADEILRALIAAVAQTEYERGITIDWLSELPPGDGDVSSRDVVNAIGRAMTKAGIENNLVRLAEVTP